MAWALVMSVLAALVSVTASFVGKRMSKRAGKKRSVRVLNRDGSTTIEVSGLPQSEIEEIVGKLQHHIQSVPR